MPDPDTFLLKDYELKISYLTNHFTRLWNRFNYFVTLETALFTGKILIPTNEPFWAFPLLGLGLSTVWYIVGAEDRYLVRAYRQQINEVAGRLQGRLLTQQPDFSSLPPVGNIPWHIEEPKVNAQEKPSAWVNLADRLTSWRLEPISTTRMAAWIPFILILIWAALLLKEIVMK